MKIFIADDIAPAGVEFLRTQTDYEIDFSPKLEEAEACRHIQDADAVIVRSATSIRGKLLDAATQLRVIGRAGIGTDNIDVQAATERGIVVLNTPDANATTTAELAIAHMFSLCRHLPAADYSVRQGQWLRSRYIGTEIADKTLGIVGFGTIGRIVANRANGLKMRVLGYDPFVTDEVFAEAGVEAMPLDTLLSEADIITLHCPLTDNTRHLINHDSLARMKPGARLVNCARGGLVDEAALSAALQNGHLAGAALDVYAEEPPANSPLLQLENVVFTPHLGASTSEAQTAVGTEIARQVALFLQQGEAINAINMPRISGKEAERLKPYQQLARKMGKLLAAMCTGPITQLQVNLLGQASELNSHTLVTESLVGLLSEHFSTPVNQVNAQYLAKRQGIAVSDSRSSESHDYLSLLTLQATFDDQVISLSGTLFDERHPRLVRINDYHMEAPLSGNLLLTRHIDKPGVIGDIGALLARDQINIATMQVGNSEYSDMAIAILGISQLLNKETLEQVRAIPAINKALQITL